MRRRALLGGGVALGLAGCGSPAPAPAPAPAGSASATGAAPPPPPHQAGIVTPAQAAAEFRAYDVAATARDELAALLGRIGDVAARPPASVTVSVGASLFDGRFGLADRRPARLTAMPGFPGDVLDPGRCHGDLLVQACAATPAAARALADAVARAAGPAVRRRWSATGFRHENGTTADGRPRDRNLFGFSDGAGNPDPADAATMDELVWVGAGSGEPAWAVGGSYQVVRLIRFAMELWNADPVERQEEVFGRRRSDGAPLGRERELDDPDYAADPNGQAIRLDAHIRRANPRTPETRNQRILRRGYSYRAGTDAAGHPDEGLIFVCFQQDLERGFATIQRRLAGEALERYILPFGGGYWFALPGTRGARPGELGRGLTTP
ncbi:Dyp-type peroxidase [Amorphoplanes digitatis]|uniref:Dyp-type peroxidase n=1 Tax=Actinoplanes digitatis TaxID=1868 RepID=UPI0035E8AB24